MAAFKAVDPTFPERIMRMTEQTVETQNKALLHTSKLESIALAVTSIGYTVLPWIVAIILAFTGQSGDCGHIRSRRIGRDRAEAD